MSKTRAKTPEGVLRAAARYIEEHGWTQGTFQDETGAVCATGAVNAVLHGDPLGYDVQRVDLKIRVFRELELRTEEQFGEGSIVDFNDAEGRTVDEVLAVFRA